MASNHAVIGREDAIWQKPSNFDFLGSLSLYGRRAFFDSSRRYNNTPDTAIPPLGRQIWSIRRRFYLFNRRYRSRIAYKNTKHSRQCNGFIFHLLADKFCWFISASAADGMNRLPSFGRCRYKTAVCFTAWIVSDNTTSLYKSWGGYSKPSIINNATRQQICTRNPKKQKFFYVKPLSTGYCSMEKSLLSLDSDYG